MRIYKKNFIFFAGIILGSLSFQSLGCCWIDIKNNSNKNYELTQSNPDCIGGSFRITAGSDPTHANRIHSAASGRNTMQVYFDSNKECSVRVYFWLRENDHPIRKVNSKAAPEFSCYFNITANEWGESKLWSAGCQPDKFGAVNWQINNGSITILP